MAALTAQSPADSYEQLLHVDCDGGGNSTTRVAVKDGNNSTTFLLGLSSNAVFFGTNFKAKESAGGTSYLEMVADDGEILYVYLSKVGPSYQLMYSDTAPA